MDVLWKALAGSGVTALIALASRRGDVLPGILPLAPTLAVITLLTVGAKGDPAGFRVACLAGARTIPAYLVFLAACDGLSGLVGYRLAVLGGIAAWLAAALAMFLGPRMF